MKLSALGQCYIEVYLGLLEATTYDARQEFMRTSLRADEDILKVTTKAIPVESTSPNIHSLTTLLTYFYSIQKP